ncbi:MAG TPA: hypothetical protein PLK94_09320 [Alphaproteobacteria bacterium]|nr:hypothetical protein [Alphaproteobacteria bacterium]HOO51471.1 hypothetical protein [Alphaproteobacteria bacterium]
MLNPNNHHKVTPWKSITAIVILGLSFALLQFSNIEKKEHQEKGAVAESVQLPFQGKLAWSETRDLSSAENATHHFEKHGKEFDFHNEKSYIQAANDFVTNPPEGTLTVQQVDGDHVFYHPQKNWFAVVSYKGQIRTFYRLDPKIHGYKSNTEYFNAQASRR